ncbi:hypothetical protein EAX61_10230 [Dokdonia sinensis]|uniref:Lipoprotein n=1 Tax=Dokdonia sinensis TaxID=2479847 RepID=A0A3M0FZ34_9FLAO|nr:hypothetical protein [Dokdonia sinensis]RMB57991.1 hypothetical protein EAX61_10230 [Dokdonia sinensis]
MKPLKPIILLITLLAVSACQWTFNPNGPPPKNYPFYITTEPITVKNITVPVGTRLEYKEHFFREGRQDKIMSASKLTTLEFPEEPAFYWGGVPVASIYEFYNTEMSGFTVVANFENFDAIDKTRFSQLWESCDTDLGITVRDRDDWSFNTTNILDVESCSVLYQRYFKEDVEQQRFLDSLYTELLKVGGK